MKFKGNFLTSLPANHSVIFTEPYMVSKGIGSFNIDSFKSAMGKDNKEELKKVMTEYKTGEPYWDALLGAGNNIFDLPEMIVDELGYYDDKGWTCTHWSEANGKNVKKYYTADRLKEIVDYHESGDTGNAGLDKEIKRIQSSVNSCVVYGFGSKIPKKAGGNYAEPWEYTAKLFIKDINENSVPNSEDERILIPKHADKVVMSPKKATGKAITAKASFDHNATQDANGNVQTGVTYKKTPQLKDSNEDMIAGGIDYFYDPNTGKYSSGTIQCLAILMEDLPSAGVTAPDITVEDLVNDEFASPEKWYDKAGEFFSGKFSTAIAVPTSMENGNPNTYGPDITLCDGEKEIDKVRAVNRSNNKYDAGQTVMLNKINGEWIVSDFGTLESVPSVAKIGRWGFSQYIANSDVLFRDTVGNRLGPEDAQDLAIYRCWSTMNPSNASVQKIVDMNKKEYSNSSQGTGQRFCMYGQCSSFDYGLNSAKNPIALEEQSGVEIYDHLPSTYHSWFGACFQQGYTSDSVLNWNGKNPVSHGGASNYINTDNNPVFHRDTLTNLNGNTNYSSNKSPHCPADIALCSPLMSTYGLPVFDSQKYIEILNDNSKDISAEFSTLCNYSPNELGSYLSSSRADIAYWTDQSGSELALRPQNNQSLVFMPLGQCTALGDDVNTLVEKSNAASNIVDQFINSGREFRYYRNKLTEGLTGVPGGRLHKFYDRTRFANNYGQPSLSAAGVLGDFGSGALKADGLVPSTCIPHGVYLKRAMISKPLAAMPYFEQAGDSHIGPGVVGITAARVRVGRRGGGTLNVNTGGMYGRIGNARSGGVATVTYQSFPPNQVGTINTSGGLPRPTGYRATWGSSSDKIFSFGAFNIFSMVWDYWPDSHTIFMPEYFVVLHFNEGISGSEASNVDGIDQITYPNTDFREPTTAEINADGEVVSRTALAVGTTVDYNTTLADTTEWKVNTVRRGVCVTGGYYYPKKTIGLSDNWEIKTTGKEFATGDKIDIANGAKIEITSVDDEGGITDFKFVEETFNGVVFKKRGEGFTADEFEKGDPSTEPPIPDGKLFYVESARPGGESATVLWKNGICYEEAKYDEGVKRRDGLSSPQLVSPGSGDGSNTVGDRWSIFDDVKTIQLEPNSSTGGTKDQYEVFFFVTNDVDIVTEQYGTGVTLYDRFNGPTVPLPSYMTMDLS